MSHQVPGISEEDYAACINYAVKNFYAKTYSSMVCEDGVFSCIADGQAVSFEVAEALKTPKPKKKAAKKKAAKKKVVKKAAKKKG